MERDFEEAKKLLIAKMSEAKTLDEVVIHCAIGVMGAFPYKDDGLEFMSYIYNKYLPPEKVEELMAKAKNKEN